MNNNFLEHIPPNELCNKCGECCRCIISAYSEKELEELDDEEAKLFLSFFKKYNSLSELDEKKKKYIEAVSSFMNKDIEIWYCPHIDDRNICTIYEDRPSFCRSYPKNGWIVTPPGCGYKGWQYEQREKQKNLQYKHSIEERESLSRHMAALDKELYRLQSGKNKLDEKIQSLTDYMWESYEMTYRMAKEQLFP